MGELSPAAARDASPPPLRAAAPGGVRSSTGSAARRRARVLLHQRAQGGREGFAPRRDGGGGGGARQTAGRLALPAGQGPQTGARRASATSAFRSAPAIPRPGEMSRQVSHTFRQVSSPPGVNSRAEIPTAHWPAVRWCARGRRGRSGWSPSGSRRRGSASPPPSRTRRERPPGGPRGPRARSPFALRPDHHLVPAPREQRLQRRRHLRLRLREVERFSMKTASFDCCAPEGLRRKSDQHRRRQCRRQRAKLPGGRILRTPVVHPLHGAPFREPPASTGRRSHARDPSLAASHRRGGNVRQSHQNRDST